MKAVLETPKGVLIVGNPQGEWKLPGGRPGPGEELEAALIRVVRKECGRLITRLLYVTAEKPRKLAAPYHQEPVAKRLVKAAPPQALSCLPCSGQALTAVARTTARAIGETIARADASTVGVRIRLAHAVLV